MLVRRRALTCNGSVWSGGSAESSSDSRSQNSSPVHRRSQGRRSGKARRALNRSCSVPDSNNPPAFSPPPYAPISMMMTDLSDITEENTAAGWNHRLSRVTPKTSESEPDTHQTDQSDADDVYSRSRVEDEETCEDADLCGSDHMSRSLNVQFQNEVKHTTRTYTRPQCQQKSLK